MPDPTFSSSMAEFSIEPVGPIDRQAATDMECLFDQLHPDKTSDLSAYVGLSEAPFVVARDPRDRRIIALAELTRLEGQFCVADLIVDIEERRKGIAEAIVRFCLDAAQEAGVPRVVAPLPDIDASLTPAPVFRRLGFVGVPDAGFPLLEKVFDESQAT